MTAQRDTTQGQHREQSGAQMRHIARENFHYEHLRPGQESAIQSIMEGRDTLAVMPTGAGKSAIYQIAGLLLSGPVVVISPLIALQRDQVESLADQQLDAAQVNSTLSTSDREEVFEELRERDLKFIFLAPEQFNNEEVMSSLRNARPSLFVVDEAHCVSEWGHDFRPEYLRLGAIIEALGHPTTLALTATASPPVREEIVDRLSMRDPRIVVRGFDRPNIWLGVETFSEEQTKRRMLIERVADTDKPGIIYAATRRHAEEIAEALQAQGVAAAYYHAGLKSDERERVQTDFMNDSIEVIVATTAFGMGIDKPNVRFVFHYDISGSVDAYYQEIGRAGRDGQPAKAILFYRSQDLGIRRFLAGGGQVNADEVERVAETVAEHDTPVDPRTLREEIGISQSKLGAALSHLEEIGAVELLPTGEVTKSNEIIEKDDLAEVAEEALSIQERYLAFARSRVEMIRGYAELRDCRREYLLNYFGEEYDPPCEFCDNCEVGLSSVENEVDEPFPLNSRVTHATWGEGLVVRYEDDKMIVLFGSVGYKTLSIEIIEERGLLSPIDV